MSDRTPLFNALIEGFIGIKSARDSHNLLCDPDKAAYILSTLTPKQRAFADCAEQYISLRCPRRSGKSHGVACRLLAKAISKPFFLGTIYTKTASKCMDIYRPIFRRLLARFNVKARLYEKDGIIKFPNGSVIRLDGIASIGAADAGKKVRGGDEDEIVVDECGLISDEDFTASIVVGMMPIIAGSNGSLILAGTPEEGEVPELFKRVTANDTIMEGEVANRRPHGESIPSDWEFFYWTAKDNTAKPHLWDNYLKLKRMNKWDDSHPIWQTQMLGMWPEFRMNSKVYKVTDEMQFDGPWPWEDDRRDKCRYVFGIDFGTDDGTALVIWCYLENEPYLYEYFSELRHDLTERALAMLIWGLEKDLGKRLEYGAGDPAGGGKFILEGLRKTYAINVESAEKHDKVAYISMFNFAAASNLIRFRKDSKLLAEMKKIRWKKGAARVENPADPNDLADAAIYGFRRAKNRYIEEDTETVRLTESQIREQEKREIAGFSAVGQSFMDLLRSM